MTELGQAAGRGTMPAINRRVFFALLFFAAQATALSQAKIVDGTSLPRLRASLGARSFFGTRAKISFEAPRDL